MTHFKMASALLIFCIAARADEAPLKFGGHLDTYYQYSPQGHVPPAGAGASILEGRVFDNVHNQVVVNMVEISLSKQFEDVVAKVDLGFGQQVDAMAANGTMDPTTGQPAGASVEPTRNITQAYLIYTPREVEDLTITIGKFYAYIGLEGFKAKDNWQYSRSFNYNFNPYWHQGIGLKYAILPARLSVAVYYLNASDGRLSQEANRSPSVGASVNAKISDAWVLNYNYLGGKETNVPSSRRDVHELNSTYELSPRWKLALDYAFARQSRVLVTGEEGRWWVVDAYMKYQPSPRYYLSSRYEYVADSDRGAGLSAFNAGGGVKQRIQGVTITNAILLKNGLEIRLEWRNDRSSSSAYFKSERGSPSLYQQSFTAAALLDF